VVAVGLAFRIAAPLGTYLSGDEATHFEIASVPTKDLYRATLTEAHPPLFFLVLHSWRLLGNSEVVLRLLSALLGASFLAVGYRWVRRLTGSGEALFALIVLAFSPALVALSAEVRGYTLLLMLMASALLVLERALERRSGRGLAFFSLLLYLAILTHYAAIWFTLAVGVYALARMRRGLLPARVLGTWIAFQVGAAALYLYLYLTHFLSLRGGELESHARTRWLRGEYFQSEVGGVLAYLVRQTIGLFRYLLGSGTSAWVGALLAVTGIAVLTSRRRPAALLLALPVLIGAGAGVAGVYPYGGTRHSAHLLPFAAAAIATGVCAVTRGRLWPALLLGLVLVPVSFSTTPAVENRNGSDMRDAIRSIRSSAPAGSLLFVARFTGAVLSYYLGRDHLLRDSPARDGFRESEAGGYRLVRSPVWSFDQETFVGEFGRFLAAHRPPPGEPIWLIRLGAEYDPRIALAGHDPSMSASPQGRFGDISIVRTVVP
jgi:predicted membrane-bound mannosyltransferase